MSSTRNDGSRETTRYGWAAAGDETSSAQASPAAAIASRNLDRMMMIMVIPICPTTR